MPSASVCVCHPPKLHNLAAAAGRPAWRAYSLCETAHLGVLPPVGGTSFHGGPFPAPSLCRVADFPASGTPCLPGRSSHVQDMKPPMLTPSSSLGLDWQHLWLMVEARADSGQRRHERTCHRRSVCASLAASLHGRNSLWLGKFTLLMLTERGRDSPKVMQLDLW